MGISKKKTRDFLLIGSFGRKNVWFSLKWEILEEKTRDFRLKWGIPEEKTRDFWFKWGIPEEKTRDSRLNGGSQKENVWFSG